MLKVKYLINIEENEIEGANFGSYLCVPVLLNYLTIVSDGEKHDLSGKLTKIGIYGNKAVFESSKGDRYEVEHNNIKPIVYQMLWLMATCENAARITLSLKKYDSGLTLSKLDNSLSFRLSTLEVPLPVADFTTQKKLTFTSDDEQFSVLVFKGFSFGITYHDMYSSKSIIPESTEDIVSGMPTFEVQYTKKDGKERLYTYYDMHSNGLPDIRRRDISDDVKDFISTYCEKGANLKMVFEAIKDFAYGNGDTIRCIDLCNNYWYCK